MSQKGAGHFFGLFGCDPKERCFQNDQNQMKTMTNVAMQEELEDGEIIEKDEAIDDAEKAIAQFDRLVSQYEQDLSQKALLKLSKKCFICSVNLSKYTCPKCGLKTCSLNCCLLHKKNFDCDGIRNRLSFVPLKDYSDSSFNFDCKFLDQASEAVNDSNRFLHNKLPKDFTNWTNRFIQEAVKRNIRYKKMPSLFKKAKENRSLFIYKEKSIMWDIEFVLPYCLGDESSTLPFRTFTFRRSRISEKTILRKVIDDTVLLLCDDKKQEESDRRQEKISPKQIESYLKDSTKICALFKHDSGKFYYLLDMNQSLMNNFAHKTIVEYPTIVIILSSFINDFNIESQ